MVILRYREKIIEPRFAQSVEFWKPYKHFVTTFDYWSLLTCLMCRPLKISTKYVKIEGAIKKVVKNEYTD